MFSTFQTTDTSKNLSVEYRNLYVLNGQITYLSNTPVELPAAKRFLNGHPWHPALQVVAEPKMQSIAESVTRKLGLCLLSDNWWYGNIGHALWDGLYPAYLAGVKFGYQDDDFIYLTSDWDNKQTRSYDVVRTFSGHPLLEYSRLDRQTVARIGTLVAGTGEAGNVIMTRDYTLYGARFDALRKFRDRMFRRYAVSPETGVGVIFIDNKRYTRPEREVIRQYLHENPAARYVDWSQHSFREQLQILSTADIHVTGPGTGMMYMPLLRDGAVNINLGHMESSQTNTARPNIYIPGRTKNFVFPAFMEQSVCAGANYVSTLYYDRYTHNQLEPQPLADLLRAAETLRRTNHLHQNNLNVDARVFVEYCQRHDDAICRFLTDKAFFIELFVNEHPLAIPPYANLAALRQIKQEFQYDPRYTPEEVSSSR